MSGKASKPGARRSLAVVRPFSPNFAELAPYGALTADYDISYFYTGPSLLDATRQLNALGLTDIRVVRYTGYTDLIRLSAVQRIIDFKIGLGSSMRSKLDEVMQYDIINVVDPVYHYTEQILQRLRPKQKLVVVRWELIPDRYEAVWLAHRRARDVFKRADAVVCTTEASRASLSPLLRDGERLPRVEVIYPGVAFSDEEGNQRDKESRDARYVVTVARLQWQKGIDDLLGAIAILVEQDRFRDVKCQIIGGGDLRYWRKKASDSGLSQHVDFTGVLSHEEVRRRIANAAVYCQPSAVSRTWCEQFGFAVVEAMSMGRPVVASHSGALPEIVGPDGVYVATRNAASLANGLAQLLEDVTQAEDRGKRLATYARSRYDAALQGARMKELFDAL